jgi:glucokinase
VGTASLVNLFAPEVVVIGGGVARAGELIFTPMREEMRRRAMRPASEWVKVVPAAMGNDAGTVGAAALVLGDATK